MDSHLVVGVGNIYASESLYYAGIRPYRVSKKITKKKLSIFPIHICQPITPKKSWIER